MYTVRVVHVMDALRTKELWSHMYDEHVDRHGARDTAKSRAPLAADWEGVCDM